MKTKLKIKKIKNWEDRPFTEMVSWNKKGDIKTITRYVKTKSRRKK